MKILLFAFKTKIVIYIFLNTHEDKILAGDVGHRKFLRACGYDRNVETSNMIWFLMFKMYPRGGVVIPPILVRATMRTTATLFEHVAVIVTTRRVE